MHRLFDGLKPTIHISHRGGAGLAPENTVEACRLAIDAHATDMLELDLQITHDGVLVAAHDDTVDRCTDGAGRIEDMSLAEVQALDAGYRFTPGGGTFPFRGRGVRIPTLAELLNACPDVRLNLEVKVDRPGIEDVLAATVRADLHRVCVGSESDAIAERIATALPTACRFFPRGALTRFVTALTNGEVPPPDERRHVLDLPLYHDGMRVVKPALLQAAHQLGLWVNVWTVDDPRDMHRLIQEGVGGIMTDRPDLLRDALRSRSNSS